MCGIVGVATTRPHPVSVDDATLRRMRDRLAHRGPDGAGLWRCENFALAHRRLAVVDLSEAAHQPMIAPGGRHAISYNGELYNDLELRRELAAEGVGFLSASDTETVLHALMRWGTGAIAKLRGMFALAYVDADAQRLVLARDPLGIKPLYYAVVRVGGGTDARDELVFASEIPAILAHPAVRARPDPITASAYLTTIRVTLGPRTLFAGVRTLLPGQTLEIDLSGEHAALKSFDSWGDSRAGAGAARSADGAAGPAWTPTRASHAVRACVRDSVRRHLRSDVPVCELLSGGIDSSIIARIAAEIAGERRAAGGASDQPESLRDTITDREGHVMTYCAGAASAIGQAGSDDFAYARMMAEAIESRHTEVLVDRAMFASRWESLIRRTGVPLSTPNEVAINAVAARIRADGRVVALSGEGADELFAGYVAPMQGIFEHTRGKSESQWRREGGTHQLVSNAWMSPDVKREAITKEFRRLSEDDETLRATYEAEFERASLGVDDPAEAHLRFIRRINLSGLLLRLDSASMLESIEGRTPIADIEVARLADKLPMSLKFATSGDGTGAGSAGMVRSKIALREAFEGDLPREIVERPKASFPLPFQSWVVDRGSEIERSEWARGVFTPMLREMIRTDASKVWQLAWPSINLALWARRWWE